MLEHCFSSGQQRKIKKGRMEKHLAVSHSLKIRNKACSYSLEDRTVSIVLCKFFTFLILWQVLESCFFFSLIWSFGFWLQQMALTGLVQSKGRQPLSLLSFFKDKRDFFPLPRGCSTLPCQSRICDWISARSASCCFRWTTDRSRVEIRRVWSSPSFRTPHMHLFLPSSQRHLRWRELLPDRPLNRPACAECKLGGCPSLPFQLSRKKKKNPPVFLVKRWPLRWRMGVELWFIVCVCVSRIVRR